MRDPRGCCCSSLTELFFSIFGFEDLDFLSEGLTALEVGLKFLGSKSEARKRNERDDEKGGGRSARAQLLPFLLR